MRAGTLLKHQHSTGTKTNQSTNVNLELGPIFHQHEPDEEGRCAVLVPRGARSVLEQVSDSEWAVEGHKVNMGSTILLCYAACTIRMCDAAHEYYCVCTIKIIRDAVSIQKIYRQVA